MWSWEAFGFGCAGATAVQILHWLSVARKGRWPKHSKVVVHWLLTLGLILISGVVGAAVFWNRSFDALFAMQTGVSAPLVINQLGRTASEEGELTKHLGDESVWEQISSFFYY
jgi:hypothetical protein